TLTVFILVGLVYSFNELSKSRSFQLFGCLVTSVDTDEKVVALTFDDGPGVNTLEILEILRQEEVKGTFYLTGLEIEQS
ncbi:polysaccharide deacetylase family protein, partial [Rhizobium ruizarguesonis]